MSMLPKLPTRRAKRSNQNGIVRMFSGGGSGSMNSALSMLRAFWKAKLTSCSEYTLSKVFAMDAINMLESKSTIITEKDMSNVVPAIAWAFECPVERGYLIMHSKSPPMLTVISNKYATVPRNVSNGCTMYVSCSHINPSVENRTNKAPEKGTIVNPKMNVNLNRSTTMSCMMSKSGPSVGIKNRTRRLCANMNSVVHESHTAIDGLSRPPGKP
mmetsp:Transcript_10241/g.30342  ORF Transcript_10241/g.30342 Transcript_10241/m.30342 type:complete len:214 (-) Transcript_10241:929-1570(-)